MAERKPGIVACTPCRQSRRLQGYHAWVHVFSAYNMRGPYGPPKEALFLLASRAARHMSGSTGRNSSAQGEPCPLISALFLGEDLSASAGWHALVRGEDDTGGRRERHTKMGKQARHALAGHGREIPLERKRDCVHNIIDYCSKNRSHGAGWQPLGGSARPAQAE